MTPAAAPLAPRARTVVRGVAAFDAAVTGVLAVPPLAQAFVATLYALSAVLGGAPGEAPVFEPLHLLFVQLAGVLGLLWAAVRLAWPEARLAVADAAARVVVAGLLLAWLAGGRVPGALLLFVATELGGAALVLAALRDGAPAAAGLAHPQGRK